MKCNIKGCRKRVIPEAMKPGQTIIRLGKMIEVYCSDAHWEQHLKEVLPRH